MIKLFKVKKMTIESDRDSVCMGDDMSSHNVFSDFPEKTKMSKLISELMKTHTIAKGWAIWGGEYDNFKCIRDNKGNWLIDEKTTIKVFFKDIKNYVFFDKESFGKKCGK